MIPVRAYDLRLATESAALAASNWLGQWDKAKGDAAAIAAMAQSLTDLALDAQILVGKGPEAEAPSLYHGQRFGRTDRPVRWDIVLDPAEGTNFLASGMTNAMACIALAPTGTLFDPGPAFFMEKLVVPPAARGKVDPASPVETRLKDLARALDKPVSQLVVYVLEKPRHRNLVERIQRAGAKATLYPAGDVGGSVMAAIAQSGIDALMGIGGSPEGMLAAVAIRLMGGGEFFARLAPQLATERAEVSLAGLDTDRWWHGDELVRTDQALFCATGISSGLILEGVGRQGDQDRIQTLLIGGEASPRQIVTSWHPKGTSRAP